MNRMKSIVLQWQKKALLKPNYYETLRKAKIGDTITNLTHYKVKEIQQSLKYFIQIYMSRLPGMVSWICRQRGLNGFKIKTFI